MRDREVWLRITQLRYFEGACELGTKYLVPIELGKLDPSLDLPTQEKANPSPDSTHDFGILRDILGFRPKSGPFQGPNG